jgi:hypothetical protein
MRPLLCNGGKYPCAGGIRVSRKEPADPGPDVSGMWEEIQCAQRYSVIPVEEQFGESVTNPCPIGVRDKNEA